jgi:hypothetical protein
VVAETTETWEGVARKTTTVAEEDMETQEGVARKTTMVAEEAMEEVARRTHTLSAVPTEEAEDSI